MTAVDIQSEFATRNLGGAKAKIAKTLESMDESIFMLSMVLDSIRLHDGRCAILEAFQQRVYLSLRRECDRLMELL